MGAAAPVHLNFPVRRQTRGVVRREPHENCVRAVYDLLEKTRQLTKQLLRKYGKDQQARELEQIQRRLNLRVLLPLLDSSSEWSSTFEMCSRHIALKQAMLELAATRAHLFPDRTFLNDSEYVLMGQVVGILRPFAEANLCAQTTALTGSLILPLAYTLEFQLLEETPVRVPAGDVENKHVVPLSALRPCWQVHLVPLLLVFCLCIWACVSRQTHMCAFVRARGVLNPEC